MKRIIVPLLVATAAASLFADDHSMVINLNDGKTYAIHNKDIKTIKFSKNDLHDKYYVFSSDTVFLHDTIYIDKIITEYETVYVHDTIYIEEPEIGNMHNGHEYVDLGLPSGLLWATCNVGASQPEDYGDYFAWGATKPQSVYDWSNTPYQTQNTTDYSKTKFTKYLGSITTSYKDSSAKDTDAMKTVLEPEDDAAHVNWGGSWRMPTRAEQDELRDSNNCTWMWTTQNGVNGYKVTSKKNGNSLFLPAAGYRDDCDDSILYNAGSDGNYWSSSLETSNPELACYLGFYWGNVGWYDYFRDGGLSVRPVCQ